MKFYFLYEHVFPCGFGTAALIYAAVGAWGLAVRRPLILPFALSYAGFLGVLIPLFLLALNHFWVAWPLTRPAALLNALGVLGCPALLCALWMLGFEYTVVGARATQIVEAVSLLSDGRSRISVITIPFTQTCCLRVRDGSAAWSTHALARTLPRASLIPYFLCLAAAGICGATAGISWCVSTQCMQ